jgi:long-chain fatty acid transport protein
MTLRTKRVHIADSARSLKVALVAGLAGSVCAGHANGLLRDGAGARAMSLGGASVAFPNAPLEAMHANPAGLGLMTNLTLQFGLAGGVAQGEYAKTGRSASELKGRVGVLPELAVAYPLESSPVTLGLSFIPTALGSTEWLLLDPTGGLDGNTTYGRERHHAEFIALRTALGASVALGERLSLGLDFGAEYNRNSLVSPYIFQSHPALRGFKTLLDLETDGWGYNGTFGLVWEAHETLHAGLSYRTPTRFTTTGDANGNARPQLENIGAGAFQPDFHYDAEVRTRLPQVAAAGLSWQAHSRLRLLTQVEWVNWGDSFDDLEIRLRHGSNTDINGFLGTDEIDDSVPLNWKDQFVYRAGLEFAATDAIRLRGGYAYGASPVPAGTLTPMSAAILEHTATVGADWQLGRWNIAAAYQFSFPATTRIGQSELAGGEFSNSRTQVEAHWFGITTGFRF